MEVLDLVFSRRSIRAYQDRKLEWVILVDLLKAAMAAPTAANAQPWEFIVLDESEPLAELKSRLPYGKYNAPAVIVVCGNPQIGNNPAGKKFWVQDCSAAIENILIAATGMGLGTVWVGIYPNEERVKAVQEALNMPEHVIPLGAVYVGYPAEHKEPRTQYNEQRVHWQAYLQRK